MSGIVANRIKAFNERASKARKEAELHQKARTPYPPDTNIGSSAPVPELPEPTPDPATENVASPPPQDTPEPTLPIPMVYDASSSSPEPAESFGRRSTQRFQVPATSRRTQVWRSQKESEPLVDVVHGFIYQPLGTHPPHPEHSSEVTNTVGRMPCPHHKHAASGFKEQLPLCVEIPLTASPTSDVITPKVIYSSQADASRIPRPVFARVDANGRKIYRGSASASRATTERAGCETRPKEDATSPALQSTGAISAVNTDSEPSITHTEAPKKEEYEKVTETSSRTTGVSLADGNVAQRKEDQPNLLVENKNLKPSFEEERYLVEKSVPTSNKKDGTESTRSASIPRSNLQSNSSPSLQLIEKFESGQLLSDTNANESILESLWAYDFSFTAQSFLQCTDVQAFESKIVPKRSRASDVVDAPVPKASSELEQAPNTQVTPSPEGPIQGKAIQQVAVGGASEPLEECLAESTVPATSNEQGHADEAPSVDDAIKDAQDIIDAIISEHGATLVDVTTKLSQEISQLTIDMRLKDAKAYGTDVADPKYSRTEIIPKLEEQSVLLSQLIHLIDTSTQEWRSPGKSPVAPTTSEGADIEQRLRATCLPDSPLSMPLPLRRACSTPALPSGPGPDMYPGEPIHTIEVLPVGSPNSKWYVFPLCHVAIRPYNWRLRWRKDSSGNWADRASILDAYVSS